MSSRDEIYTFLEAEVSDEVMTKKKIKNLLEYLSETELRHIDFLIYLTGYYQYARSLILSVILEILLEDQRVLEALLSNFNLDATSIPKKLQ